MLAPTSTIRSGYVLNGGRCCGASQCVQASSVLISIPAGEVWLYKDSFWRGQYWRITTDTVNLKQLYVECVETSC